MNDESLLTNAWITVDDDFPACWLFAFLGPCYAFHVDIANTDFADRRHLLRDLDTGRNHWQPEIEGLTQQKNLRRIPGESETLQLLPCACSGVPDRSVASNAQLGRTLNPSQTSFWGQGSPGRIRAIGRRPIREVRKRIDMRCSCSRVCILTCDVRVDLAQRWFTAYGGNGSQSVGGVS